MTKRSPFRYFKTSPEFIRLAIIMYARFPLSQCNVEDLLHGLLASALSLTLALPSFAQDVADRIFTGGPVLTMNDVRPRAEALIAAVHLAGTNTRRVKRALFGLFQGASGQGRRQPRLAEGEGRRGCVSDGSGQTRSMLLDIPEEK